MNLELGAQTVVNADVSDHLWGHAVDEEMTLGADGFFMDDRVRGQGADRSTTYGRALMMSAPRQLVERARRAHNSIEVEAHRAIPVLDRVVDEKWRWRISTVGWWKYPNEHISVKEA